MYGETLKLSATKGSPREGRTLGYIISSRLYKNKVVTGAVTVTVTVTIYPIYTKARSRNLGTLECQVRQRPCQFWLLLSYCYEDRASHEEFGDDVPDRQ